MRATTSAGIVSPSAFHVLASAPGGSFERCRESREIIEIATPYAANIRTLSARYIADLQDHWEIHGQAALDWDGAWARQGIRTLF
jgi:hypothetical protein